MNKAPGMWVKWYAQLFALDTADLSFEEAAIYRWLLDLMFCNGGHITSDPRSLLNRMRYPGKPMDFQKALARLIDLGMIHEEGGHFTNERAAHTVGEAMARSQLGSKLGKASGERRAERSVGRDAERSVERSAEQTERPTHRGREREGKGGQEDKHPAGFNAPNPAYVGDDGMGGKTPAQIMRERRGGA